MGGGIYLSYPLGAFAIPADTVVGPTLGTDPVYNFTELPGGVLAHRYAGRVVSADPGSKVKLNGRIITPGSGALVRSDPVLLSQVGLASDEGDAFAKPSGIKRLATTAQMDTAGKAGSAAVITHHLHLVDARVSKLWNLWIPSNAHWDVGNVTLPEEQPSGVAPIAFFDFSQIPDGATCKIVVAGMGWQRNVSFSIRISSLADYNNAVGTVVATGSWPDGISPGTPFSAVGTFPNEYSGLHTIKATAYAPTGASGTGFANSLSAVLMY